MSPCSTVHGGKHDTKYVAFELLLRAAFVADNIWMPQPHKMCVDAVFTLTFDTISFHRRSVIGSESVKADWVNLERLDGI